MKVILKNSSLVFKSKQIVYKTYATTANDNQYVKIAGNSRSLLPNLANLAMNNIKVTCEAMMLKKVSKAGLFSTQNNRVAIYAYSSGNSVLCQSTFSTTSENKVTSEVGKLYSFGINTNTGECNIDNTTYTDTPNVSTSAISCAVLLGFAGANDSTEDTTYTNKGVWKIKSFKAYNATTNELVADIVPALVDNVPCLYDKVSCTELYTNDHADGGRLVVE